MTLSNHDRRTEDMSSPALRTVVLRPPLCGWKFGTWIPHLLLAWEGVVVTWHISHDGLLIGPQGANDVCAGNRKEGEKTGTGRRETHKSKRVQRPNRSDRGRNHRRRQRQDAGISSQSSVSQQGFPAFPQRWNKHWRDTRPRPILWRHCLKEF